MDRRDRFASHNSQSYEARFPRSYTSAGDTPRRHTKTPSSAEPSDGVIDLHDLNDWIRRSRPPPPPPPQDPRPPRRQDTDAITEVSKRQKGRPSFVVEKPVVSPGWIDDDSIKTPELRYDQNFLHPPTPNRNSFIAVGLAAQRGGNENEDDTAELRPRRLSVMDLERSSRFGWWTLCLLLITVLMVTLTAIYSNGSAKSLWQDKFFTTSSSNAILILRVMTEACALLLAGLIVVVVEDLQWALASRPEGVGLLHFIGLDSGTGVWGLLRLLATADWRQKYSSLFRLVVICIIPLPGIVLMGDITLQLVFFPQQTYDIAAGIGAFNASYISQVDDSTVTALLVSMGSPTWGTRDTWTSVPLGPYYGRCTHVDGSWAPCDESHMLVGGVLSISPQRDNLSVFPDSTAYVVPHTRSVQLEYGTVHDLDGLYNDGTCYLIGSSSAASYWCTDTGLDQELLFGSSYCPLAIQSKQACLNDTSWTSPLQIASSLFVYSRHGTVSYSRTNFSILSVTDLSVPERQIVKLDDYMLALSAVVPGFTPSTNDSSSSTTNATTTMKGDNSALAIYAVTALPLNDNEVAKKQSLQAIRKAMSVPFNYFHANYFSDPSIFELHQPRQGLSEDMYTTLSISVMSHQVVAGRNSRWLFGLLSGLLLTLSAATMLATVRIAGRRPQRCGYPTLDFAAVCAVKGGIPRPPSANSQEEDGFNGGHGGGGGRGGGGGVGGGKGGGDASGGDGGEAGQTNSKPEIHGLYRSLTALGQKPAPFQVARRIKDDRVMLGKY